MKVGASADTEKGWPGILIKMSGDHGGLLHERLEIYMAFEPFYS